MTVIIFIILYVLFKYIDHNAHKLYLEHEDKEIEDIKFLKEVEELSFDNIDAPLGKVVSARHQDLLEVNKTALQLGYDY